MAEGMSSGEPSFCHTILDIMHVDAPSSMNCDVLNFYWYLKSDQGGKTRFSAVKIKGVELSINRFDYAQGGK
jgi:hypothetical protein